MTGICDAYSGGCVTPGPTVVPSTAPPAPSPVQVETLPYTGGEVVLLVVLALVFIALGVLLTRAVKATR